MAGMERAAQNTGLERLSQLETVTLHQLVSDTSRGNSYTILNEEEVLFNLIEETPEPGIIMGGNRRGFHMDGVDTAGKKVFSFRRPGGASMSDKLEISMNGELVSVVRLERPCCALSAGFSIDDAHDVPNFRLKGRACTAPPTYKLKTMNKTLIGGVVKKNLGWRHEQTSRNDDYVVTFPADLPVHFKIAVTLTAVLIDFRFHDFRRN